MGAEAVEAAVYSQKSLVSAIQAAFFEKSPPDVFFAYPHLFVPCRMVPVNKGRGDKTALERGRCIP